VTSARITRTDDVELSSLRLGHGLVRCGANPFLPQTHTAWCSNRTQADATPCRPKNLILILICSAGGVILLLAVTVLLYILLTRRSNRRSQPHPYSHGFTGLSIIAFWAYRPAPAQVDSSHRVRFGFRVGARTGSIWSAEFEWERVTSA
jgi:hypothetical protein